VTTVYCNNDKRRHSVSVKIGFLCMLYKAVTYIFIHLKRIAVCELLKRPVTDLFMQCFCELHITGHVTYCASGNPEHGLLLRPIP